MAITAFPIQTQTLFDQDNTWTGANTWTATITLTPEFNQKGFTTDQLGYDEAPLLPVGFIFNEINVDDYSSTNVVSGFGGTVTYKGDGASNWGSSNSLTEKVAGGFEARVFAVPTGSPGPHQPVALSVTSRVAPGIGACPTVELFAGNFITLADSPVKTMIGNEYDMAVGASGSCVSRIGINVGTSGAAGTAGNDVAFVTGGDAVAKWAYAYSWFPNTISGTILGSQYATSCVNGIDLSAATFSGSQIKLAMGSNLKNAANDAAAAGLGVVVGEIYRNGSILMVRVA